jgi:hypothetical protein
MSAYLGTFGFTTDNGFVQGKHGNPSSPCTINHWSCVSNDIARLSIDSRLRYLSSTLCRFFSASESYGPSFHHTGYDRQEIPWPARGESFDSFACCLELTLSKHEKGDPCSSQRQARQPAGFLRSFCHSVAPEKLVIREHFHRRTPELPEDRVRVLETMPDWRVHFGP